jgi:hypothetical protein
MVGQVFISIKDVCGIAIGLVGTYLGMGAVAGPIMFVDDLNNFISKLTALMGTFGCLIAASTIVWQNFSKSRKQIREDILGNKTSIESIQAEVATKNERIDALTREALAARLLAASAAKQIETIKAEASLRIVGLETELAKLHQATRRNANVVSVLKMESDLRKASPDPDRPPSRVEIVNTADHPVPTTTAATATADEPHHE